MYYFLPPVEGLRTRHVAGVSSFHAGQTSEAEQAVGGATFKYIAIIKIEL